MKLRLKEIFERVEKEFQDVEKKARLCRVMAKSIDYSIAAILLSIPGELGVLIAASFLLLADNFSDGKKGSQTHFQACALLDQQMSNI